MSRRKAQDQSGLDSKAVQAAAREKRLAQVLRENIAKRKAQVKAREAEKPDNEQK
jgi:hypothetical protein